MELSRVVADVCLANAGVLSLSLAEMRGIPESSLLRYWRAGHLKRVLPGVFAPAGAVVTSELKLAAAALWAPRGIFCDRTAIWMMGL